MMDTHPTADRLEAFIEGVLEDCDRVVVASHIVGCARCQSEVEEWRSLFAALSSLPSLEPAVGFADRVMLRVRVAARPHWHAAWWAAWEQAAAHAAALAGRLTPKTTFGWGLVAALLALPVALGGGIVAWLVTRSYLTPQALWLYTRDGIVNGLQGVGSTAIAFVMRSELAAWTVARSVEFVDTAGMTGVGAIIAAAGVLTMLSIWILYRNLFRTPTRESDYATFSF
ncbi:MAG: hypothetical protein WD054_01640 [Gemmatimonadota bacterium]